MFFRKGILMKIVELTKVWLPAAVRLAEENYEEERRAVPALPKDVKMPALETLAANGLGVAAVEGEELLGFLGAYGPFGPVFCTPDVCGVFSPIHAHGARQENRSLIYQRMYQAAAEKWVKAGASSHAISLYAPDVQAKDAFYTYGFGMRCMDLIRHLSTAEPETLWQSNIFGKSVYDLIQEGLSGKLLRMPGDVRDKFRSSLSRIVNEGATGLICLIL